MTWKLPVVAPDEPGGDHDYWYLINLAMHRGMDFGSDISTTYGPLFFLTVPAVDSPRQIIAAFLVWTFASLFSVVAIYQGFRVKTTTAVSATATGVVLLSGAFTPLSSIITMSFVYLAVLGLLYCNGALPLWAQRLFPAYAAVLTAAMALNKFSVAGMCGAVGLATILAVKPRIRGLLEFACIGLLTSVVLWCAVGQHLFSLPVYVYRALSVGGGQSGAMGLELRYNAWEYVFVAPAVGAILVALITMRPRGRWSLLYWAFYIVAIFLLFKQAFVRHDAHSAQFFALAVAMGAVSLAVAGMARRRLVASGSLVALLVATQIGAYGDGVNGIDPARRLADFGQGIVYAVSQESRSQSMEAARQSLIQQLAIPDEITNRIGAQDVYVEPFNFAAGYAYGFHDAILPTLLEYGAYNHTLDSLNADWFEGDSAPELILRRESETTLDGRNPHWDAPQQKVAEFCNYKVQISSGGWTLLERRAQSRCNGVQSGDSMKLSARESVPVPERPGTVTVARVFPEESLRDRVAGTLFKRDNLFVGLSGQMYRFPWGHEGSQILVSDGKQERNTTLSVSRPATVQFDFIEIAPLE